MCKKCLKMRILFAAGGFVIGAAVGAGATALVCRKKMREQEEEINSLLEEVNALDDTKVYELSESKKDTAIGENIIAGFRSGIMSVDDDRDALNAEMEQVILREGYGRVVPGTKPSLAELAQMAQMADEEEEEEPTGMDEDPSVDVETSENSEEGEEPHEITAEDFLEDNTFEKDQLTFYVMDETLCDSDDDVLDIDSYIGYRPFMEAVEKIMRRKGGSVALIYWRNPDISCDFEIELRNSSYVSTVLGVDDSERGGYKRGAKKRMKDEEDD